MEKGQRGGPGEMVRRTEDAAAATVRHVGERIRGPVHQRVTVGLQIVLVAGAALAVWQQQWLAAVTTLGILVVTLLPLVLGRRFEVFIPAEFEALTVVFVFASLFLGEVRGYYARFWWWDAALHTASGFLLGILGFLLVYVLNEKEEIDLRPGHLHPGLRVAEDRRHPLLPGALDRGPGPLQPPDLPEGAPGGGVAGRPPPGHPATPHPPARISRWVRWASPRMEMAQCSMRVPRTSRKRASHAGWAGQAGAVTRFPSTKAPLTSTSCQSAPAALASGPHAG